MQIPSLDRLPNWLAAREAQVPGLELDVCKRVIWASGQAEISDLSIVYIHGFSASSEELRPFPDDLARGLSANLYFSRLTGHGQEGSSLGRATLAEWHTDSLETLNIGRILGKRVVVIACSTGVPLVLRALAEKPEAIAACIFVSPNFGLAHRGTNLMLQLPWVRHWGPLIMGRTREFETRSEGHEKYWTTRYDVQAIYTMMEAVSAAAKLDLATFLIPLATLFCPEDQVVSPEKIRMALQRWGGPRETLEMDKGRDTSGHLLLGTVMNPEQTDGATDFALDFCRRYLGNHL